MPVLVIFMASLVHRVSFALREKPGQNTGRVHYMVGFYWTERGHQSYKHEADSDEANTRGSPHFAADPLPTARFPKSIFQSRVPQK